MPSGSRRAARRAEALHALQHADEEGPRVPAGERVEDGYVVRSVAGTSSARPYRSSGSAARVARRLRRSYQRVVTRHGSSARAYAASKRSAAEGVAVASSDTISTSRSRSACRRNPGCSTAASSGASESGSTWLACARIAARLASRTRASSGSARTTADSASAASATMPRVSGQLRPISHASRSIWNVACVPTSGRDHPFVATSPRREPTTTRTSTPAAR